MKIIVIGCGRVGAGLAQTLSQRAHQVTVVDSNPDTFERLGRSFKGQTVEGIGFDRDVLKQAGIERADGLAAVTSSDETNVVTAQVARQMFHVPRVVARLYDRRQAEIYERLGLQTIALTTWGVNRIADLLCYSRLDPVFSIGSGDMDLIRLDIPPLLAGHKVDELALPGEALVVSITRRGHSFVPTLGALFERGDIVHLAVASTAIEHLNKLLELS
jgi:trk system potassium uptake protein TrkA